MSILYTDPAPKGAKKYRAAVYIRFSSHKQADSFSIEYQKEECMRYIENKNYKFTEFYIDEAKSAKKTAGREALEQMLSDAGKGKFDKIVVFSFSRSFRNTRDALNYNYQLMEAHGICIESVIEPIDMSTPHGKYGATNLFAMHELNSDVTAAHVKSGMNVAAQKGYYLGGYVPFGYDIYETGEFTRGKPRKKFKVNEEEAVIITQIYELYAANCSLNYIQQNMRDRNVVGRKGKILSFQTICRILRNPFYIGIRDFKIKGYERIYLADAVPAIISEKLWKAVQERHIEYKESRPVIPRQTKRLYALTGKIVCAKCGAHLTGVYKGSKRKEAWSYAYYHCQNKKSRSVCNLRNIRKDFVENYCLEQIKLHILAPDKIAEIAKAIVAQNAEAPTELESQKVKLVKRQNELMQYLKKANKKAIEAENNDDKIEQQLNEEIIAEYKAELSIILTALDRLKNISETTITTESVTDYLNSLMSDAESADPHIIKSLFEKLIEKVVVYDDKVVLHLVVSLFVYNRDKLPSGQPKVTLMTEIEKVNLR